MRHCTREREGKSTSSLVCSRLSRDSPLEATLSRPNLSTTSEVEVEGEKT